MENKMKKEKIIKLLVDGKIKVFNRWRQMFKIQQIDLGYANLRGANLTGVDLDFSVLSLSCKILKAKFDKKHIIQFLYHAGMPCQNNNLKLDSDLEKLLNSKQFIKVVSKFHREDVVKYKGTYKKNKGE